MWLFVFIFIFFILSAILAIILFPHIAAHVYASVHIRFARWKLWLNFGLFMAACFSMVPLIILAGDSAALLVSAIIILSLWAYASFRLIYPAVRDSHQKIQYSVWAAFYWGSFIIAMMFLVYIANSMHG